MLGGSFSETQGSKDRIGERFDVVLTPIDQPHADTFHDSGGRCFFVEIQITKPSQQNIGIELASSRHNCKLTTKLIDLRASQQGG